MNKLKKIGFGSLALATTSYVTTNSAFAAIGMGAGADDTTINEEMRGSNTSADKAIQTLMQQAMVFLGLAAVCYAIYGGFLVLSAAGDENKVKKGKTILFQALLGLLIIFLAYSIVNWLIGTIFGGANTAEGGASGGSSGG